MKKLIIIFLVLLTCSCSDYKELSSIKIVSSIFIDYKDNYNIYVSYYDKEKTKTISCSSVDLTSTINMCNNKIDNELFYTHLNTVFITSSVNIDNLINYVLRNPRMNNNFYLVNTDINTYLNEDNIGKKVSTLLSSKNNDNFFDIINTYVNKKHDIYIPIYNDNINTYLLYKGNKPSIILDKYNSRTLDILTNKKNIAIYNKYDNDYFSYLLNDINTDIKVKNKNVSIKLKVNASISEITFNIDTSRANNIKLLEDEASLNITGEIYYLIDTLKENNIDVLGINKNFSNYNFDVDVDIKLFKKGFLLK